MHQRTACNCQLCQAGCKTMPGYLTPADLPDFDPADLCASEGAALIYKGDFYRAPTIVPQQRADGTCVFYEAGRCTMHQHSPFGCRMFNTCDNANPSEKIRELGVLAVFNDMLEDGPYSQLQKTLPPAVSIGKRKAAFEAAIVKAKRRIRKG